MIARPRRTSPVWSDVKGKLAAFDRAGLVGLVQDLYAANEANRTFLHARFGLGADLLAPYKAMIERWLWPNVLRNQDVSVTAAKKAISDFRKAAGQREGLAELMVFYCERAAGFAREYGMDDPGYLDALVRMFEQALKVSGRRGACMPCLLTVWMPCVSPAATSATASDTTYPSFWRSIGASDGMP
jgi:hypothetical protein